MNHTKTLQCTGAAVVLFAGLFAASAAFAFGDHDLDLKDEQAKKRKHKRNNDDDDDDKKRGRDDDDDDKKRDRDDDDDDKKRDRDDDDDDDDGKRHRKDDDDDDGKRHRKDDDDDDGKRHRKDDDDDDGKRKRDDDDDDGRRKRDDDRKRQVELGVEDLNFRDLGDRLEAEATITGLTGDASVLVEIEAMADVSSSCAGDQAKLANDRLDVQTEGARNLNGSELQADQLDVRLRTDQSREHAVDIIPCPGARLEVESVDFLDARIDVSQGNRVLTLLCTFTTPTVDGEVAPDNVECWAF